MTVLVELSAFKQTFFTGHRSNWAEPALGFSSGQSPRAAVKNVLQGSTVGKYILLIVPKSIERSWKHSSNGYAGKIYSVVELAPEEVDTIDLMRNFPDDQSSVRNEWIEGWPKSLPILKWYDIVDAKRKDFSSIHPGASTEAKYARGKLRKADWLTRAAALTWQDLRERPVWPT